MEQKIINHHFKNREMRLKAKGLLNTNKQITKVKEKFLGIDYNHMQYILGCFDEAARNTEIKNIKEYKKAVISSAPTTIDYYFIAKVRYDRPWQGKK